MIYTICNVVTGELLQTSTEPLSVSGHPLQVKTFDVDLTKVEWDRGGLNFKPRNTSRMFDKLDWRRQFSDDERLVIDEFNASFESNPLLTVEQKRNIRTGLKDYEATQHISKDDIATSRLLGLYEYLGFIAEGRAAEILA